jgi:hypothetical protein
MSHNHTDLIPLRAALAHRAADLAVALLGSPNPKIKTKGELRYGSKGSFSVTITGPKAGIWCDNESGTGGDMLDLIMRERGCKFPDALSYAREFCGVRELSPAATHHHSEPDAETIKAAAKIKRIVSDIWNDAVDARGTLVETYLASRGLRLPTNVTLDVIRYHPSLYYDGKQRVPGMDGGAVSRQRVYGVESLRISKDAIDLSRMQSSGIPILDSHKIDSIDAALGKLQSAWVIDGALKGRVRFNQTGAGVRAEGMVRRGELGGISVGYRVTEWEVRDAQGQGDRSG